jgi:hypothetical protein
MDHSMGAGHRQDRAKRLTHQDKASLRQVLDQMLNDTASHGIISMMDTPLLS